MLVLFGGVVGVFVVPGGVVGVLVLFGGVVGVFVVPGGGVFVGAVAQSDPKLFVKPATLTPCALI